MATCLDIIKGSMRLLGVLDPNEQPSASEAQDALFALNALIDTWKTEALMVYAILPQTFALVGGQKTYTLGPSGNWNTERPVKIDSMYLQYTDATSGPPPLNLLVVLLNQDQYNAIIVPNTTTTIPTAAYIDDGFPLRTVSFWPVPTVDYDINLFTWSLIDGFDSVTDDVSLPPGYERLIRFNLALELAPEFGRQPSQIVAAGALSSKAAVKRNNVKPLYMACDPAVTKRTTAWNYLTGV
jgi:hypothetical protein